MLRSEQKRQFAKQPPLKENFQRQTSSTPVPEGSGGSDANTGLCPPRALWFAPMLRSRRGLLLQAHDVLQLTLYSVKAEQQG